jgi:uncharacterized protein (TIGR02246 family)
MTFTRIRVVLVALLLTSAACAMSSALIASPVPQEDEAAIKHMATNFGNAFSSHDAHAVVQFFTAEAGYTTGGPPVTLHGQKAIEDHLTPLFVGALQTVVMKISVRDVEFVTPDVAIVNSDVDLSGLKRPDGTDAPAPVGFFDWVVTKQNGQWLIAGFHESLRPRPPQGPPPAAH